MVNEEMIGTYGSLRGTTRQDTTRDRAKEQACEGACVLVCTIESLILTPCGDFFLSWYVTSILFRVCLVRR